MFILLCSLCDVDDCFLKIRKSNDKSDYGVYVVCTCCVRVVCILSSYQSFGTNCFLSPTIGLVWCVYAVFIRVYVVQLPIFCFPFLFLNNRKSTIRLLWCVYVVFTLCSFVCMFVFTL